MTSFFDPSLSAAAAEYRQMVSRMEMVAVGTVDLPAVQGSALCFRFGGHQVLNGLDLTVRKGAIYGLLGPSGCGKTTLLRCIVGRHRPGGGTIRIYGREPGQKGFCVPGPGVGYMPQELALYPEITTEETLTYFGRVYQMSEEDIRERVDFLTEFLDIPDKAKQVKELSGGQQRRVSFAAAIIHKPPLVILDEPTVGVDPLLRQSIWNYLQKLASVDYLTIIITTHYVEEARQAHVVGLMRDGRLLAEANPEHLIRTYGVATLEDVFLKLCDRDSKAREGDDEEALKDLGPPPEESPHEEVWVPQKREYSLVSSPARNGGPHPLRTSLLDSGEERGVMQMDTSLKTAVRRSGVRLSALIRKNFTRQKRNIALVIFQLIIPTFQVIVFCLCVGGEPFDLPLAVVNSETDPAGKSAYFLEHISPRTIIQVPYSNLTPALESVQSGENWGVLYIRRTFTDAMINRYLEGISADNETIEESTITLYLDMTNQQISMTIYTKIMESFKLFADDMLKLFYQNPLLSQPPIVIKPVYGLEKPEFTEFMVPGMIAGITYIMAVGLSSMSIIIEKKEGLLDRSLIAGVRAWEVVFSILFTLFLVLLFQCALILVCTFLAFGIQCRGSFVWVIIAALLVGLEGMCFGLFISAVVNDENIANMISLGSFYPNVLLSGIIWPVEAMPYFLRQISYGLPLTLIAHTMRCVISRGWSIFDHGIWSGYLAALAWIVPVIIISSIIFRYKK